MCVEHVLCTMPEPSYKLRMKRTVSEPCRTFTITIWLDFQCRKSIELIRVIERDEIERKFSPLVGI